MSDLGAQGVGTARLTGARAQRTASAFLPPPGQGSMRPAPSDEVAELSTGAVRKRARKEDPFLSDPLTFLTEHSSHEFAACSAEHRSEASFVVNSIFPHSQYKSMPVVVGKMLEGLSAESRGRVSIVLGMNATKGSKGFRLNVANAKELASKLSEEYGVLIDIKPIEFEAKYDKGHQLIVPYGSLRNQLMSSHETRGATERLVSARTHAYISFQDFDAGDRRVVGSGGRHIFDHLNESMKGGSLSWELPAESPFDEVEAEAPAGSRPLMIGGGYYSSPEYLTSMLKSRLGDAKFKQHERGLKEVIKRFSARVEADMSGRGSWAKLHPLLPYSPEPNMFVDATAVYKPSPSGTRIAFGDGGTEFLQLANSLGEYNQDELTSIYQGRLGHGEQEDDDVRSALSVAEQTLVHPTREFAFDVDFGRRTETDLSRLLLGFIESGEKALPQENGLADLLTYAFKTRKDKSRVEVAGSRNALLKQAKKVDSMASLVAQPGFQRPKGLKPLSFSPDAPPRGSAKMVVGGVGGKLSSSISPSVASPWHKAAFLHQMAVQSASSGIREHFADGVDAEDSGTELAEASGSGKVDIFAGFNLVHPWYVPLMAHLKAQFEQPQTDVPASELGAPMQRRFAQSEENSMKFIAAMDKVYADSRQSMEAVKKEASRWFGGA